MCYGDRTTYDGQLRCIDQYPDFKTMKRRTTFRTKVLSTFLLAAMICSGSYNYSVVSVEAFTQPNHLLTRKLNEQKTSPVQFHGRPNIPLLCKKASTLHASSTRATHSINEFVPKSMTLKQSMVFFAKYLFVHQKEQAIKKKLSNPNSIRSKLWPSKLSLADFGPKDSARLEAEVEQEKLEKKPFFETLQILNSSRKELIELVGYDSSLLISCFGFATLAAFMNSVIPHYYGQSVNCLANALTTCRTEVIASLAGLGTASVLCALFTGIRGALFWLAGMLPCIQCFLYSVQRLMPISFSTYLKICTRRLSCKLQHQGQIAQKPIATRSWLF